MKKRKLLLVNAKALTMDDKNPRCGALEVSGQKISATWKTGPGAGKAADDEVIDCRGRTVLPGFIDAHQHFMSFARSQIIPQLGKKQVKSIRDIRETIRLLAVNTPEGAWIRATGYHVYDLEEKRNPTKWDLDEATKKHPVVLTHSTGYINVLNSTALAKLGIGMKTVPPEGGAIERDLVSGEPNGILFGMRAFIAKFVPEIDDRQIAASVKVISAKLAAMGITSLQDASIQNGLKQWKEFEGLRDAGILLPRITMMIGAGPFSEGQHKEISGEDDRLKTGPVKIVLHEASGELYPPRKELHDLVLEVHRAGKQAAVHAIEEHVVKAAAKAIANAQEKQPRPDSRHRIEHCTVCRPELAAKLAELGIVPVVQPNFVYYNGDRYLDTVPAEQQPYLYPFKTLMEGMIVAAGSDGPVVAQDPLSGICAAAARLTEKGNRLNVGQKVSLIDAIKMYTINAAYSAFEERRKGSITVGKLADLVILDRDIEKIDADEIRNVGVDLVIIGGEVVYRKGSF
jgi:predicted amidohydrolase YtcJ